MEILRRAVTVLKKLEMPLEIWGDPEKFVEFLEECKYSWRGFCSNMLRAIMRLREICVKF